MAGARDKRFHEKDSAPDQRTPGQRDRDRVLYTSALRRLAGITQVVSPTEGVLFHNRLTHTLEVAQIGRRLAEHFAKDSDLVAAVGGLDPERVEAAALAHDLGHPPFGHTAEVELDRLVTDSGVLDGYEGNAQAFRIVTRLAVRNERFPGLNLTRATLNAILKYPWTRQAGGDRNRKWGVYSNEQKQFDWVKDPFGTPSDKRSAEAELMDWADDIAYAVHDLEDFYRAGIVPLNQLSKDEDEKKRFLTSALDRLKGKVECSSEELTEAFEEVIEPFAITEPYQGTQRHRAALRSFTASLIGEYINAITFDTPGGGDWKVQIAPRAKRQVAMLKQLIWHYVILDPSLGTQQYGQRRVIRELFRIFKGAAKDGHSGVNWGVLPKNYQEELEQVRDNRGRVRIVADIIASMTEQQALKMHQRLTGVSPGSVRDPLNL